MKYDSFLMIRSAELITCEHIGLFNHNVPDNGPLLPLVGRAFELKFVVLIRTTLFVVIYCDITVIIRFVAVDSNHDSTQIEISTDCWNLIFDPVLMIRC